MKANVNLTELNALTVGVMQGIERLVVAHDYARVVQRDQWEFAVEIQSLHDAGMNNAELRWLICKGLVAHALEEREEAAAKSRRVFRKVGDMSFRKGSCFVLTKKGLEAYRRLHPEEAKPVFKE